MGPMEAVSAELETALRVAVSCLCHGHDQHEGGGGDSAPDWAIAMSNR